MDEEERLRQAVKETSQKRWQLEAALEVAKTEADQAWYALKAYEQRVYNPYMG